MGPDLTISLLDRDALAAAAEDGLFLMPAVPGLIELVDMPGVRGRIAADASPSANTVGSDGTRADRATLMTLVDRFRQERKGCCWWRGGPREAPSGPELSAAGFTLSEHIVVALAVDDLSLPIPLEPDVTVREAYPGDYDLVLSLFMDGFSTALDFSRVFVDSLLLTEYPCRFYIASIGRTPAAMAFATYFDDRPVVSLSGAATLPAFRGRGLYRALVSRRMRDAAADGKTAAVIQARTTSAPILRRVGFSELFAFERYVLAAPEVSGAATSSA